jgi:hypothetical protein
VVRPRNIGPIKFLPAIESETRARPPCSSGFSVIRRSAETAFGEIIPRFPQDFGPPTPKEEFRPKFR